MAEVHDGASLRAALLEIAGDFSFTWIAETRLLFDALGPRRFAELHHNPTALLSELTDEDLGRALTPEYRERLARVQGRLARDRGEETWWRSRGGPSDLLVAYFSAEFGLDESLPIYSGGLGVLAGDYLKAASELGLPLVGIGLFYRRGYFRQRLDETDRQIELYPLTVTTRLPLELVPMAPMVELADDDGNLVPVQLAVWRARVGRTSLYLIDTHVEGNPEWAVTDTLYGGNRENRLRQEVLLGVGGVRVLRRLGLEPTVFHLNEGHSAFLQLERMRELVEEQGLSAAEAIERLRASTVFTTHTPVPAGNEVFDPELVRRALGGLVERCGLVWEDFVALGKTDPSDDGFGLTPFALRTSQYANGVSELHGAVSREMWHGLWPEKRVDQVPITSVTNGVHQRTWISGELEVLLGDTDPQFERARDPSHRRLLPDADMRGLFDANRLVLLRAEFHSETRELETYLDLAACVHGLPAQQGADHPSLDLAACERGPRVLGELLAPGVDDPRVVEVPQHQVGVAADEQAPLPRVDAGDPGRPLGDQPGERVERHAPAMERLVQHDGHHLLHNLAAVRRREDVVVPPGLLLYGVGTVVADQAVDAAVEDVVPHLLHQRPIAQRRSAPAERAQPPQVIEIEQQVVRADLDRGPLPL